MDNKEEIKKIAELVIEVDGYDEELFDEYGVNVVSLVSDPAIEVGFFAFSEEFIDPRAGEDNDTFLERCMGDSKMVSEYPETDQRYAVCNSYYDSFSGSCEHEMQSYNDYPKAASENAKRALKWAEENGWGSCGTDVGKQRANQLAKGENISRDTIARMAAFERHRQNKDTPYGEGCGKLMWDAWGGDEGIEWAQRKLEQIDNEEFFTTEAEDAILDFCTNNGTSVGEQDLVIDLSKQEFATISEVVTAIQSLDILRRLKIKRDEPAEEYWRYTGPPAQRKFCRAMMNLSNAGKIFSKKDIQKMDGINSQFAKKGQSSYSIFKYKGGKNCKHYWQKLRVFRNEDGRKVIIVDQPRKKTERIAGTQWQNMSYNFSYDEDKRIVTGPLMIPNKMIIRKDRVTDEKYYVYFSKETIRKMSEKFLKMSNHNNTDLNHDHNIMTKNTLLETWISESVQHDKSYKYGFNLPIGTWYVSYKINDDASWEKIKNGEIRGFSLAGDFVEKLADQKKEQQTLDNIKNILRNVD